jgi:protein-L-isoaspartate(D-aspartate) O-methyltransferase
LREEGISDERVLDAIGATPRHLFIEEALATRAYEDTALPIGQGQTISQPFVVAMMTAAILRDGVPRKVLEIGTGSGYQAAILARIVPEVFTVERIGELLSQARRRFRSLRLHNVRARHGDGNRGWPEQAPFDAIVVTAAAETVPEGLMEQLRLGGVLVAPVGSHRGVQELVRMERTEGEPRIERLGGVSFVPLLPGTD